jgi:hypothetical protein
VADVHGRAQVSDELAGGLGHVSGPLSFWPADAATVRCPVQFSTVRDSLRSLWASTALIARFVAWSTSATVALSGPPRKRAVVVNENLLPEPAFLFEKQT